MEQEFYHIETAQSFGNHYLKVFVDDQTLINTVVDLIQTLDCVKTVKIKEYVSESTGAIFEAIEVCPDTGIRPCVEENFEIPIKRIRNILNEINDEVLGMRKNLSDHTDALKVFDRVIYKMVIGEYTQELVNDMCNMLKILSDNFTNAQVVSSIKQIKMPCENITIHKDEVCEIVTKLFNAIRTAIGVINNKTENK